LVAPPPQYHNSRSVPDCNGCVKFEFNDIKSSYTINYLQRLVYVSLYCQVGILYDIIAIKVIYFIISTTVGWINFCR